MAGPAQVQSRCLAFPGLFPVVVTDTQWHLPFMPIGLSQKTQSFQTNSSLPCERGRFPAKLGKAQAASSKAGAGTSCDSEQHTAVGGRWIGLDEELELESRGGTEHDSLTGSDSHTNALQAYQLVGLLCVSSGQVPLPSRDAPPHKPDTHLLSPLQVPFDRKSPLYGASRGPSTWPSASLPQAFDGSRVP